MSACNNCPFKKSSPLDGSPDWLRDVLNCHREDPGFFHSCHKTDPSADGYAGAKKKKECAGHFKMIINALDETPGRGGVYDSIDEMIETYLKHWLGSEKFSELKSQSRQTSL